MEIQDNGGASDLQYLFVPVDIPFIEVVHTVSLQLYPDHLETPAKPQTVAIGRAIPAELNIQHTRKWSNPSLTTDDVLEFCFEVHASPDTWLIGGLRKAHFSAKVHGLRSPYLAFWLTESQEHEILRFPLVLLPQKTGHLIYPSIDITVSDFHDGSNKTGGQGNPEQLPPTSEVDYKNQGDSLVVISDRSSTTISINLEDAVTGAWLIDSESRRDI